MRPVAYTRADTVETAVRTVGADPGARFIAGGTEVLNLIREGQDAPDRLVDVNALPLRYIEFDGNTLHIGALAKRVHDHPDVLEKFPALAQAGASAASPQVRNMATAAGNLLQRTRCGYYRDRRFPCNRREPGSGCAAIDGINRYNAIFGGSEHCIAVHPSDLAVALTALDAVVHTRSRGGARMIPLAELYRLPGDQPQAETVLAHGEMVTAINVPHKAFASRSHYLKVRDRASFAFALVSVAVAVHLQGDIVSDVRIVLGGVAPRPWRASAAESVLRGERFDDASRRAAGRAAVEGAVPRAHNGFKVTMVEHAVARALSEVEADHG
ncbi:FAD binding domain-containing protein [Nocardia gipuzkoensis]